MDMEIDVDCQKSIGQFILLTQQQDFIMTTSREDERALMESWIQKDVELKTLNANVLKLRRERQALEETILKRVFEEGRQHVPVQFPGGQLEFKETKVQEGLTYRFIEDALSEIITNKDQIQTIMQHLQNRRRNRSKVVSEIKRVMWKR